MASKSVEDVPFPGIDVQVEAVSDSSGILVKEAMSTARPGPCPNYQKQARRLHSTYQRTLNEQPLGTRRVIVRLRVRRYFRARKSCSRTTFVEQIRGLSTRYRVPTPDWRARCGRSRSSSAAVPPHDCAADYG